MGLRPGDPGFLEAYRLAVKNYAETHTLCRAEGCRHGFVALDPTDIDCWTEEPRRTPCPTCNGSSFVHIQMDLPF
jgi:hypothetical protein